MSDKKELITLLKEHLKKVQGDYNTIYTIRLKNIIERLEANSYIDDEDLVVDLESVGFRDKAIEIRRGMYT